ncbi:hypothetical protein ATANTOWER_009934 [Ataeniobius toweri]|uniref:Uncharacterized protein n=1 Tax=Ataeniobius toweri TaxID=208326 RepID=A0ABU7C7C8_9TELE|nr:hypothetical protein [Ataeniobius toweri]
MTEEFREAVNRFTSPKNSIDHHLKELFEELQQRKAYTFNILNALEVINVNVQQDAAEYFERILRKTSTNAAQRHKHFPQNTQNNTTVKHRVWFRHLLTVLRRTSGNRQREPARNQTACIEPNGRTSSLNLRSTNMQYPT